MDAQAAAVPGWGVQLHQLILPVWAGLGGPGQRGGCVGLLPPRGSLGAVSLRNDPSHTSAGFTPSPRDEPESPCCAMAAVCLPTASLQQETQRGKPQKAPFGVEFAPSATSGVWAQGEHTLKGFWGPGRGAAQELGSGHTG